MRHGRSATLRRVWLGMSLLVALSTPLVWNSPAQPQMATSITTCGSTIVEPGSYTVDADLTCVGTDGIDINSSNVTLRLNGHTITSLTCSSVLGFTTGIHVNTTTLSTLTRIHIFGDDQTLDTPQITGFQFGIVVDNSSGSFMKFVSITSTCQDAVGIRIESSSSQWKLDRNIVSFPLPTPPLTSASVGIDLQSVDDNELVLNNVTGTSNGINVVGSNNTVVNNTASMNTAGGARHGISVSAGGGSNNFHANETDQNSVGLFVENGSTLNNITGNSAFNNTTFDMRDENPNCDSNKWRGNHFNTSASGTFPIVSPSPCIE